MHHPERQPRTSREAPSCRPSKHDRNGSSTPTIMNPRYLTGTRIGGTRELVRWVVRRNLFCTPTSARRPTMGGRADLASLELHGETILMGLYVKRNLSLQQAELKGGLSRRPWSS